MERMSAADYVAAQRAGPRAKRANKYGAKKCEVDGFKFDSQREARRYLQLRALEKAGELRELKLQVPIMLTGSNGAPMLSRAGRQMRLTVDFSYYCTTRDRRVYEDAKGKPTRDYEVRKAAAVAMGYQIDEV